MSGSKITNQSSSIPLPKLCKRTTLLVNIRHRRAQRRLNQHHSSSINSSNCNWSENREVNSRAMLNSKIAVIILATSTRVGKNGRLRIRDRPLRRLPLRYFFHTWCLHRQLAKSTRRTKATRRTMSSMEDQQRMTTSRQSLAVA